MGWVHYFLLTQKNHQIQYVVESLKSHSWDREVTIVGLTALASAGRLDKDERSKMLAQDHRFAPACERAVINFPEPDAFIPALKLLVPLISTDLGETKTIVEALAAVGNVAAEAINDIFQKKHTDCWDEEVVWVLLLEAMDVVTNHPCGPDLCEQLNILDKMTKAWMHIQTSQDEARQLIVK